MALCFEALLFLSLSIASAMVIEHHEAPSFQWIENPDGIAKLQVNFPEGGNDVIKFIEKETLSGTEKPTCIMKGYFETQKDVMVTLTGGCPFSDTFEVTIIDSAKLHHRSMFGVIGGIVTQIDASKKVDTETDIAVGTSKDEMRSKYAIVHKDFPPNGLLVKVGLISDKKFRAKFKNESKSMMLQVLAHGQLYFLHKSLPTRVYLEVAGFGELDMEVQATSASLNKSLDRTPILESDVDVIFTVTDYSDRTKGMAFLGHICEDKKKSLAIVEHYYWGSVTAEDMVHEIGHQLGMKHDFDETPGYTRKDSKGTTCTDIGGVMDYSSWSPVTWSTCSAEDFQYFYNLSGHKCLKAYQCRNQLQCPDELKDLCFIELIGYSCLQLCNVCGP